MTLLFVSDTHLSPERPAITRAFFSFLRNKASQADALYILGDLVEVWIGDDDPSELSRQLVSELRRLSDEGVRLYFQHGNRDFLAGKRFALEAGVTILPDYYEVEKGHQRLLLCHGDTLCTDDIDYQKFRRKVRKPLYRWLLSNLPLKKRQQIAQNWRSKSQKANSNKPDNIMDVNPEAVDRKMLQHNATTLIHGHTHRPGEHDVRHGRRIVLGDWDRLGWYISVENGNPSLVSFSIQ